MENKELKKYVDYLLSEKIKEDKALELLTNDKNLSSEQKNIIYKYCYPRVLGDRELPKWIQPYLISKQSNGFLTSDFGESVLLIEAARTEQYSRFMKHLFFAFSDPSKINPVSGTETLECPICGKKIYEHDIWNKMCSDTNNTEETTKREFLAFGSSDTSITLCLSCIIQLTNAKEIINSFDPGFLDWTKNSKSLKRAWESFKIL